MEVGNSVLDIHNALSLLFVNDDFEYKFPAVNGEINEIFADLLYGIYCWICYNGI